MADSPATPEFPLHVLSEYALLADGERGILVGPRGDFVWMCAPRWDSDAVFSALIGGAGVYAVTPVEQPFVWGGYYEPGSLIWRSRWITTTQAIECREALAMPGDRHTAVALRRVEAIDGDTRVRVVFDPRAGFGRHQPSQVTHAGGVWTARSGPLYLRWSGMKGARHRADGSLRAEVTVPAGDHLDLVLEVSDRPLAGPPPDPAAAWSATRAAWDADVPDLSGTIADRDARQAYAVLRGLTSAGGGMVAAATTSLPERAEAGRNYDYRYAWIRDQCYAGEAVAAPGPYPLLDTRGQLRRRAAAGRRARPEAGLHRRRRPGARRAPACTCPATRVATTRSATGSTSSSSWTRSARRCCCSPRRPGTTGWITSTGRRSRPRSRPSQKRWRRARRRHLGARRPALGPLPAHLRGRAAGHRRRRPAGPGRGPGAGWPTRMLADVSADCLHPSGRWQRAPDDDRVDAALLLPAIRGAMPAGDPRGAGHPGGGRRRSRPGRLPLPLPPRRPAARRGRGRLPAVRLRHGPGPAPARPGGRGGPLVRAQPGRLRTPGLLTEEYDVTQRQVRGNVPQAFVHALLLESAQRLAAPWPAAHR